ncbi:hypothetical protein BDZ89DRAFT_1065080, partial [Hymenopellis radicata]
MICDKGKPTISRSREEKYHFTKTRFVRGVPVDLRAERVEALSRSKVPRLLEISLDLVTNKEATYRRSEVAGVQPELSLTALDSSLSGCTTALKYSRRSG